MLRAGFVGTGRISDLHALEYLQNERAQIAAVCDIDEESAQRRADGWNVPPHRVFTNHHDLLALPDLDLIEILLPHHLHHPVTLSRDGQTRTFDNLPTGWEQSFIHATRHLIDALRDGAPPRLTGDEGRTILRPLLAAHHSARIGQSVHV